MERTEMKRLFKSIDGHVIEITQMIDFLQVMCQEEWIEDTGKYLYIIINLLKNECEKLDIDRYELEMGCLD